MRERKSILIKRIMLIVLFLVMMFPMISVKGSEKGPLLKTDGSGYVTHLGSSELIQVNKVYEEKDTEFRGVWVSPLVGNLGKYISKDQYKNEIISILDTMDYYNMNVMIFHIRIMNDAFYESDFNNWSSYYNTSPDWEALPWIIEECHKRGIEFHAWMNPYRVTNNVNRNVEELAKEFPKYNPASDPNNLLVGKNAIILNPGLGVVRDFLLNTCMEVVRNYDVDAIHFDDYFYDSGVDDSQTRLEQGISNAQLADWRRKQVDTFIEDLSSSIRKYNKENGKSIQLGISPSGVWRSGNGVVTYDSEGNAITNGSNTTTTFEHYGDYLYSDTLKWINEEWIDYILPQTYWAIEHPMCAYYDLLEWWSKVVKYKKVSLYSGFGLYLNSSTGGYSWYTNPYEAYNQTMICNTLENVEGIAIFDYSAVKNTINNDSKFKGMKDLWDTPKILPEIKNTTRVVPSKISGLTVNKNSAGNLLSWNEVEEAKFYVVYRSENEITYSPNEVIDIIGKLGTDGTIDYTDLNAKSGVNYYYAVKAQSYSNTLGPGATCKFEGGETDELASLGDFETLNISTGVIPGSECYVSWDRITYPFGNTIKYEVSYSLNDGEEVEITNIEYVKYLYNVSIKTKEDTEKLKIKIRAYNNVGETVHIYESAVSKGLGAIRNFGCLSTPYANTEATFAWTLLDIEDVNYDLQYSYDMAIWETVNTKIISGEYSAKTTCKLVKDSGNVYYRIIGEKDGEYGYSNIVQFNLEQKIGKFNNLKINGEEVKEYYLLEEGEVLSISFDKFSDDKTTYNALVSSDLSEWKNGRQYNTKFTIDVGSDTVTAKLPIKYYPLKIYVKVTATSSTGSSETMIFVVYTKVNDNFIEDILGSLDESMSAFVEELDIYN